MPTPQRKALGTNEETDADMTAMQQHPMTEAIYKTLVETCAAYEALIQTFNKKNSPVKTSEKDLEQLKQFTRPLKDSTLAPEIVCQRLTGLAQQKTGFFSKTPLLNDWKLRSVLTKISEYAFDMLKLEPKDKTNSPQQVIEAQANIFTKATQGYPAKSFKILAVAEAKKAALEAKANEASAYGYM